MNTAEKCEAILKKMLDLANSGKSPTLESDWGDFSATIYVGSSHTHIGLPGKDGNWESFIDQLYNVLHGGPGLSWANPENTHKHEN